MWDEPGGGEAPKTLQLAAPQWVSFNAALTSEPAISKELPKWITAEPISALDRRASISLAQPLALPTDRLARLALLEVVTSRPQKEVRWLALRCLGYIGQFDDMVKALNDPARKLDWPEYVDQLREAVARDSESAAAVRLALEKQYPQQAADLYRMLWGYTDKDLQSRRGQGPGQGPGRRHVGGPRAEFLEPEGLDRAGPVLPAGANGGKASAADASLAAAAGGGRNPPEDARGEGRRRRRGKRRSAARAGL